MSAPTPSEAQIDAALDATVCEGESVRFYLEAYAFANDDEVTCRIMTREVIATAIRAALGATPSEAVRGAVQALEAARRFIRNGVEFGYIQMPDPDMPDSAHYTLPTIEAALAALSLHVGDAADTSDALGASASPTACSGPLAPEPLRVSALRVPPAGAGGESDATTCNRSGG